MTVDLETAIDGAETYAQIADLLQEAEAGFVVIDEVWQGRQVTSPNHPGSVELLTLSKRVANQFEQKGCTFEESKTLKQLCQKISDWHFETEVQGFLYVTGLSNLEKLIELLTSIEPKIGSLSQEEAIQSLVNRGIIDEAKLPAFIADLEAYDESPKYDCDYFDQYDDPSLWFTEVSWNYQFPGVEMPRASQEVSFNVDGEEFAAFSIFTRAQIETAKAQVEGLNRIGA